MTTEKKNYNFKLNINYLLYTSKSIYFSHIFVYYRSIVYSMLLRFFKVESAVIGMIMFFGFLFGFGFFLFSFGFLEIRIAIVLLFFCINSNIWHFLHRRWIYVFRNLLRGWIFVREEGTVVAGRAYLLRCTSFYDCISNTTEKRRRVFPFPNNHRRPNEILTTLLFTFFSTFSVRPSKISLFLQRLSSLFFLLWLYGLAFPRFLTARQVKKAAVFRVRIG